MIVGCRYRGIIFSRDGQSLRQGEALARTVYRHQRGKRACELHLRDLNLSEDVGSSATRALLLLSRLTAFKVPYDDVTGECR